MVSTIHAPQFATPYYAPPAAADFQSAAAPQRTAAHAEKPAAAALPPPPPSYAASVPPPLPADTLHSALWGKVRFTPYPTEKFQMPRNAPGTVAAACRAGSIVCGARKDPGDELVRVFLGQLPYFVTDMQLAWLCYTFGGKHAVVLPERIVKRQACGERLPTGCVHARCSARAAEELPRHMMDRLLVDDTGVWSAQDEAERAALARYVQAMKRHKHLRAPHRPYDTVVVQLARSKYRPAEPTSLNAPPTTAIAPAYYGSARSAVGPQHGGHRRTSSAGSPESGMPVVRIGGVIAGTPIPNPELN